MGGLDHIEVWSGDDQETYHRRFYPHAFVDNSYKQLAEILYV